MKDEDKTIINISVNNNNELNFKFDVDTLLSIESLETFYTIVGTIEKMKKNVLDILSAIEKDLAEEQKPDENDIDNLLN
jgi:hypothetical protein